MLDSGKNYRAKRDKIKIFQISCCPKKKFLNETKNHNSSPQQVKWSVPKEYVVSWYGDENFHLDYYFWF